MYKYKVLIFTFLLSTITSIHMLVNIVFDNLHKNYSLFANFPVVFHFCLYYNSYK